MEKFPDLFKGIKIGQAVGGDCLRDVEGNRNNLIFCTVGKFVCVVLQSVM